MVQVVQKTGTGAQRFFAGLGKSLAEQIPQEVERGRLAQGLNQFQENAKGLTPLQQAIELYKIPGFTAEMGYTLKDLLRQEQEAQGATAAANRITQERGQRPAQVGQMPPGQQSDLPTAKEGTVTPIGPEQAYLNPPTPPNRNEIDALAADIRNQDIEDAGRPRWNEFSQYQDLARDRLNSEYNQAVAYGNISPQQQAFKQNIENELKNRIADYSADFPSEITNILRDRIFGEVGRGEKTVDQATKQAAEEAREMAEGLTTLTKMGGEWFPDAKLHKNNLKGIKEKFKDYPLIFSNKLVSDLGVSRAYGNSLIYPVENNKEIKSYIGSLKPVVYATPNDPVIGKKVNTITNDIADKIGKNDSLGAIALELQKKGYNPSDFMQKIRQLDDQKPFLNNFQRKELDQISSFYRPIRDYYYQWLGGEE